MENKLNKHQATYDVLKVNLAKAKAEVDKFNKDLIKKGFYIDNNVVKADEKVFACFYDVNYYSHFDGHTSDPIYNVKAGAKPIYDEAVINYIQTIIKDFDTMPLTDLEEAISEATNISGLPWEILNAIENVLTNKKVKRNNNQIGKLKFEIKPDYLKITYVNPEPDQNECGDGDYIEFRKATTSEIKTTKKVDRKDRG